MYSSFTAQLAVFFAVLAVLSGGSYAQPSQAAPPPHSIAHWSRGISIPPPPIINPQDLYRLISCDCTVDGYDFCAGIAEESILWTLLPYGECTTRDNREPFRCTSSNYRLGEFRATYGGEFCEFEPFVEATEAPFHTNKTLVCNASPDTCTVTYSDGWFLADHDTVRPQDPFGRAPALSTADARCPFSNWPADGSCGLIEVPPGSPYANFTFPDHKYCCGRSGGVPTAGAFGFPCGCAPDVPCFDCGAYPSPDDIPWHDRMWTDPQLTRDGYALHPLTSDNAAFDKCLYQPFVATDEQTGSRASAQTALYDNCRLDPSTGARWCCAVGDGRLPTFNPEDADRSELTGYCECASSADSYVYPCDYCGARNTAFGGDYPDAVFVAHPNARRVGPLPPPPPFGVPGEEGATPTPTAAGPRPSPAGPVSALFLLLLLLLAVGTALSTPC